MFTEQFPDQRERVREQFPTGEVKGGGPQPDRSLINMDQQHPEKLEKAREGKAFCLCFLFVSIVIIRPF